MTGFATPFRNTEAEMNGVCDECEGILGAVHDERCNCDEFCVDCGETENMCRCEAECQERKAAA